MGQKRTLELDTPLSQKKIKKTKKLPSSLSIFTAETYAILETIKYADSNNKAQIVIYIDSMSVTKSLMKSYDQENHLISTIQELHLKQTPQSSGFQLTKKLKETKKLTQQWKKQQFPHLSTTAIIFQSPATK